MTRLLIYLIIFLIVFAVIRSFRKLRASGTDTRNEKIRTKYNDIQEADFKEIETKKKDDKE
jgi:hypothetical protein